MSEKEKDNPSRVTVAFCNERFMRIMDKMESTSDNILDKLETTTKQLNDLIKNHKQKGRDWRMVIYSILGSVISAGIICFLKFR